MATDFGDIVSINSDSDVEPYPDWLDFSPTETDSPEFTNFNRNGTGLSKDSDTGTIEVVYGSYPDNYADDDESDTGSGSRQFRTKESESARERERLARSRIDTARLPVQPTRRNAPSDAQRRVTEQNKKSLSEAIRRWSGSQQFGNNAGDDTPIQGGTDGRNVTILTDTGAIVRPINVHPIPSPDFLGCEFEGVMNKLWLANNGEWIVQFRVSYETKNEASKLDQTPGMSLKIRVEQI